MTLTLRVQGHQSARSNARVEGFEAQARARRIAISAKLEPLFPIQLDAALISKVLNNLIDNAIKYSPAGLEVLVETQRSRHARSSRSRSATRASA